MSEKVVGYVLLLVGILISLLTSLNVYQVFTLKSSPIQTFNMPGLSLDLSSALPAELKSQPGGGEAKAEILKAADLNFSLNLFAHVLLAGFILNLGIKLAGLGIQLLRPIEVKLKTKDQAAS